jgi:hypothetical protein
MTEPEEVKPRRRRTRQEVQRLVSEFGTSGLSRGEFSRIHAMTLSTLQRGLKRRGILAKGRRIELSRDFDAAQLRRVVEALEGF